MDVLQYLMTKDLQDIFGREWNPVGTQKWYKEMLDFELESYKRRTTEDLEELKDSLENAVREHRWRDLEYGTLEPLDVINWRACRDELARRGNFFKCGKSGGFAQNFCPSRVSDLATAFRARIFRGIELAR